MSVIRTTSAPPYRRAPALLLTACGGTGEDSARR
jgi:hypothetical protein